MADVPYQRLTRAHTSIGFIESIRTSLWLGADHLLLVEHHRFEEHYKRFHYRDIQAVIIKKTGWFQVFNVVSGLGLGIFVPSTLLTLSRQEIFLPAFCGAMALLFALLLGINLWAGKSCACTLQTAVQTQPLRSIKRIRQAKKILARIRPMILSAQETPPPAGQLPAAPAPDQPAFATPPAI